MKFKINLIFMLLLSCTLAVQVKRQAKTHILMQGAVRGFACNTCKEVTRAVNWMLTNEVSATVVEYSIIAVCSAVALGWDQWYNAVSTLKPAIQKGIHIKTLDPEYFWEITVGVCEPTHYKYLNSEEDTDRILSDKPDSLKNNDFVDNLYKEIAADKKDGNYRETILMYHISDAHVHLDYQAGTSNTCNSIVCCNKEAGEPKSQDQVSGKWGDYNWDTNPIVFDQLQIAMQETGTPDIVIWTGDSDDHSVYKEPEKTTRGITSVTKSFMKIFEDTVMFPIHGNHEFAPSHQQDFSADSNKVIEIIAELWDLWLTKEVKSDLLKNSYFSYEAVTHPESSKEFKRKLDGTHIISLNTQNCYFLNFELIHELNDPGQEFEWLESKLREIESKGELAILIGHIPPGDYTCLHNLAIRIRAIHDRFQHIIRLNLFGHSHMEEFEVHRAIRDSKPIGTTYITSSLTTFMDQNPSIRVFTLDMKTKLPIKIETYTMDITKANQDDRYAKFVAHHDIVSEYGLPDLSPSSMLLLANKIKEEEGIATKYQVNKFAGGRGALKYIQNGCDEKCRRMAHCDTSFNDYKQSRMCYNIFDFDIYVFMSIVLDFLHGAWVNKI